MADKPPALRHLFSRVLSDGPRDAVLWRLRAGLAALDAGEIVLAERTFEEALGPIEALYANSPAAERARSLWAAEREKEFRGEAHERAMAFLYRGLIELARGDHGAARATFAQGLVQTTYGSTLQDRPARFATLSLLEGFAGRCAGLPAAMVEESFAAARSANPELRIPARGDTLVLFETGAAPIKVADGLRRERLTYAPPPMPSLISARARTVAGGDAVTLVQGDNLYQMAVSQGGRAGVDAVNQGKAQTQAATEGVGTVATAAGLAGLAAATQMRGQDAQAAAIAGGAALVVGLVASAAATGMRPEADVRAWDNLPGNILIGSLPSAAAPVPTQGRAARSAPGSAIPPAQPVSGPSEVRVDFAGARSGSRTLAVRGTGECRVAWGRELSAGGR